MCGDRHVGLRFWDRAIVIVGIGGEAGRVRWWGLNGSVATWRCGGWLLAVGREVACVWWCAGGGYVASGSGPRVGQYSVWSGASRPWAGCAS